MGPTDVLATISELALGLVGFTGIVVVFGRRSGRLTALQRFRLYTLLMNGFGAMFLALLPFGLRGLGMSETGMIRLASGSMGLYAIIVMTLWVSRIRGFWRETPEIFDRRVFVTVLTGHGVNVLVQLLNTTGLAWEPNLGVYVFGLVWFLAHGSHQFVRILFVRPGSEDQPPSSRVSED